MQASVLDNSGNFEGIRLELIDKKLNETKHVVSEDYSG